MKKILLSSMVLFSVLATAQNKTMINISHGKSLSHHSKTTYQALRNSAAISKSSSMNGSAWFNVLDYNDIAFPGLQVLSPMHLFPDSNIILGFTSGNEAVYAWIHKAAIYMDPMFMGYQNIIDDKFATYTTDSISVGYSYIRGSASNITDSLIIQIIAENHALDWDIASGAFSYQDIVYDQPFNDVKVGSGLNGVSILKRISYPLTVADTTSFYSHIKLATSGIPPQTNSKKIGAVVSFKPGYTYTNADTLIDSHRTNTFYIWSSEQQGDNGGSGTDPFYFGVTGDYTSDMNMSYIIPTDIRYNQNGNGWNGYFIPTYAYTAPFAYENHDIGFKLTNITVGSQELENSGFALDQNSPNPFSKESTVNYKLSNDANVVTFTVTDVSGRIIYSEKVSGTKGSHSVELGTYASGLYYYSLNVDGKTASKKMIIK